MELQQDGLPAPAAPFSGVAAFAPGLHVPNARSTAASVQLGRKASPSHLYELGLTAAAMSYHTAAIDALRDCTALAPNHAPAWRKLAKLLRLAKEDEQANAADAAARASDDVNWKNGLDERTVANLQKAEQKLVEPLKAKSEDEAAMALREHLIANPLDAVAMRFLARLEVRGGDRLTARTLSERALDICPGYTGARMEYCQLLVDERDTAVVAETERLLADAPDDPRYGLLHADALMYDGKVDAAIVVLTGLLRGEPNNVQCWLLYGNALRVNGRREEAVQAYRKCLQLQPDLGVAWWGMAELKDKVLTEDDIAEMRAQLEEHPLASEGRMAIYYALGQTLERAGDYAASFAAYEEGAREHWAIKKNTESTERKLQDSPLRTGSDPVDDSVPAMQRLKAIFSRENLNSKLVQSASVSQDVPIFVIGMPRAGSTLVEQILSSHSLIEGIGERSLISDIKQELASSRALVMRNAYPNCLLEFDRDRMAALGAQVIAASRNYRTTDRLFFVDKRPWNWIDIGLIHLILPQAKFIDVRREPMAACFAMYKQMLPRKSCEFSYDFDQLGRYYNTYVKMMEHWHAVLPGRVHFVQYEQLVENTEREIRRMLDYCGLPFDEGCLRYWETDRAIVTPSAEQVRRPIYRHALEQWRNFEPWLNPLKDALAAPVKI
jgi:tetratricopeptide (TPR) repeat protein